MIGWVFCTVFRLLFNYKLYLFFSQVLRGGFWRVFLEFPGEGVSLAEGLEVGKRKIGDLD